MSSVYVPSTIGNQLDVIFEISNAATEYANDQMNIYLTLTKKYKNKNQTARIAEYFHLEKQGILIY